MASLRPAKFRVVRPSDRNGLMTEEVVSQVRVLIREGKLRPGDRLPPERELSRQLGISRASLRTGLRFLSAIGVLTSRHGSGTYIAAGPPAMWTEILLENKASLIAGLDDLTETLNQLKAMLQSHDAPALEASLARAKESRDTLP